MVVSLSAVDVAEVCCWMMGCRGEVAPATNGTECSAVRSTTQHRNYS